MKRIILFLAALTASVATMAQSNIFNIEHTWMKSVGYSYQPAYPYGFSLAGGSLLSVGFGKSDDRYTVSATEYREPTWSMRFGLIGYNFDQRVTGWGAITFRPMFVLGFDKTKDYTLDAATGTWEKESETYFSMTPTLVVNVYAVHFSVGYEIVPKFSEINGLTFGVGISFPTNTSSWATSR